ncbi:MAG TPA: Ig-like domain-containing protein, partial [Gaiellaceae bacterium]
NFSADAGTFTSPDTSVSGGHCYRYTFTIADNVGNISTAVTATAKVDTEDPSVSLDDPGTPVAGGVSLSATASDGETNIQLVTFERAPAGTSSWTTVGTDATAPYTANWDTTLEADGLYDLRAVATDTLDNSNSSLVANRRVDNTAPDTSIDSTPADPSNDVTPTFAFSSSESGSSFECRVDGGGWSSCSSPHTLAALGAGSHTFDVRATDQAGNTDGSAASYGWTIDLTAPDTTINSSPPSPDNDATPTFAFSSSEPGSSFECRIDGGGWASCTSPHTSSPALPEGSRTFDVRAVDQAGNADSTPASHTWILDLGAPTVTITAPTTYVNGTDPSSYPVTTTTPDTDVTHVDFYECSDASIGCATGSWSQFDTDNSAPYSGSWSTPGSDGPRAIRAVAVDAAANTGADVRTITIDRTPPSGVTVSYPNNYVSGSFSITTNNGPDPDVNASSGVLERQTGDLANGSCSSYGGWSSITSPDTVASGKCAKYRYRLADNAGNWSTATSSNEVKSDTDAPTSSQADPGANLRQTVTLSSAASDTGGSGIGSVAFQRRPSGGGSWTTIGTDSTSPYSASFDTTGVGDGLYDFRSVATDVAGNAETSPAVIASRRIDNTAPSATMLSPGNPVRGTVTLTSTTSDGGSGIASVSYELAPNGGSFNSQPSTWDTTLSSDGLYDLRVTATDLAGNSTTSSAITTRVDNTAPALTFSSPASGNVVTGTVSLVASASDASPANPPVSFAYKLHSDPPSAYASTGASWNTTALPAGDGLYDLRARATDDASNSTTLENTSILVDNVPPSVSITAPATAINGSLPSPTSFTATASDPSGSGVSQVQFFECSNQSTDCSSGVWSPLGTVAAPGPYSVSWTIPGTDGNHALAAVATDNAGHPSSAIRNVDVDRTAPNTTIVAKPADPSNAATPAFTFSSSEAGSTFECRIDGGSFAPCTSPHDVSGLTDNSHIFEVRATDPAGNTDATPDTWTWHRDTNAPAGTLNNPGANIRQSVTLTSSESDPPADGYASGLTSVAYEYSADGTTWAPIGTLNSAPFDSLIWNTTGVADGVYQLHLVVGDVAGNSTTSTAVPNVRIDNTPPTTSQNDPGQYLRSTKMLTASAADSGGSGIDHVDFQRAPTGSGSWTTIATDSTPGDGFQASFDTTAVSDGHYDFRTVAYDVAGNQTAATPVTDRLVDNTPPNATINNPGAYLRGSVSLTSSTSDPGGANASGVVTVAYEYSTNGGTTWQSTGASFDSTSVADGNVELHVIATDAAGNATTSSPVTSLVDNTKPATTDNAPSGWQSSAVTVTLTANDAGAGVNVTEYSVDGSPTYTVGTSVVIPAPADGSNDGAHTIAYFSVDNAGNIETVKSATVLIDATPPVCPSCSAADYLRGTVTLNASPDPDGSGIQSVAFEYTDAGGSTWTLIGTDTTGPAPYSASWDTTSVPDGHYDLRIRITDNADNVTTANLPDKVVDNTAPDVATVGAPTEGQLVTGTVAVTASASDATSPIASVQFLVRGSLLGTDTTAPFSLDWNTTTGADGAATIQVIVTDMAGNSTTSAVRNVSVDNVSPAPTLADPGQYLNGTISLSATSDPDTTEVDFERRPAGGGSWVTIASDTTLPWDTSLDTTALADGLYDFRAVATDQTGHTGTSAIRSNIRVDNTAPSGSLTAPASGATVGGSSVALGVSVSDAGSGVASVRYELRPTGGGSFTQIASSSAAPFGATWDATTVATGSYDLRPLITDRAGNTFTGATVTVDVDVTAPTVVLANPGATISGTVTLTATVTGTGAAQVVFGATPAGGGAWTSLGTDTSGPWSVSYDTTKLSDGMYDLRATVSDGLGNSSYDVVAGIRIDNTAPRIISSTPADGSTVTSVSSISLVASEAATPVGVTLDGGSTVTPVVSGTNIDYGTGPLGAGPHTLAGELQDAAGKRAPFQVHFTVWPASGSIAPYIEKNTSSLSSTTIDSADAFAAVTMPAGAWSTSGIDWIVLRVAPTAAPSGLTNGFGPGPEALDVTAWWALAGTQVHQFSQPVSILLRSTEKGLVPATFESGNWRVIHRVPTAGMLPAGWDDGFFTDAAGFHVLTKHLSLFALLRDLEPPRAPQDIRGFAGPGGLTIRWLPGADNSGTYDYVTVFADSTDAGHYGVDYTAATVAGWKPGDPRVFRLKETDLAGNVSELSRPLLPVPSLVGMTPDQAEAALKARGFTVGDLIVGGTGKPGTVTGPEGLVLAEQGSAIDLTVAPGGASTSLVLKVITAPKFKPAANTKIAARLSVTRAARVTAQLYSPRQVKLFTWRFSVKAGRSILKLRIPRQVRRSGLYSMRWTARAGRATVARTIKIRVVGTGRAPSVKPVPPVEVVLAGRATRGLAGAKRNTKFVSASGVEPTFDAAASRKSDVRVIVIDVDELGVALIRELHTVFPSVKIVGLASGPRTMAAALRAGAAIVLPRSTPPATLAKVIQKLLAKPSKPAKASNKTGR